MATNFKAHMMYDKKTGKAVKAPTKAKHLELKDKGYGHTKPKKMKAGGYVIREDDKRRKKQFEKGGRNLFNVEDRQYLKGK